MSVHAQSIKIHLQMLRQGKNNSLDVDGNVTTAPESRLILLRHLLSHSRPDLRWLDTAT